LPARAQPRAGSAGGRAVLGHPRPRRLPAAVSPAAQRPDRPRARRPPCTALPQGESELDVVEQELADGRGSRDRLAPYKDDSAGDRGAYKPRSPRLQAAGNQVAHALACIVSPVRAAARGARPWAPSFRRALVAL
jgi:hypothetical protein